MERPKAFGIALVGFSFFALYMSLANLLWFTGILSLPLGSSVQDPTPFVLIAVTVMVLYVAYRRRRLVGAK